MAGAGVDADTVAFLEGGCALIVGTVGADGSPHASRGWGLDVLGVDPLRFRLLLDATDERAREDLAAGRPVAVTGADVVTLSSMQLKGTPEGVESAGRAGVERCGRYVDAFYRDITETDGTPRAVLERITPDELVAVVVTVADHFDQTPGPDAGSRVGGGSA